MQPIMYAVFLSPTHKVGAGGYVFLLASVRASIIASVRLRFRDCMFPRYLQYLWMDICQTFLVHLETKMNSLCYGVKRSKIKATLSRRWHPALNTAVKFRFLVFFVCI